MIAADLRGLNIGHQVCYNRKVWRVSLVQEPPSGCNPFDTEVLRLASDGPDAFGTHTSIVLAELHRVSRLATTFPDLTKVKL